MIGGSGESTADQYDFVVELIGEAIRPTCRGDDYYGLVYEVEGSAE